MSVFSNNLLLGAGGQSTGPAPFDTTLIGNSVWLDGSADFLSRTNFTLSADGKKEFIFSMWIQRNEFGRAQTHFDLYPTGYTTYNDGSRFTFPADDQLAFSVGAGGSSGGQKHTTAMYRDIGWYHVLISYNTNTSVTAASRHQLFVNGLEISDISTYTAPPDNQSCIGSGTGNADLRIGRTEHSGIPYPPNAYFAQACYLEGKSIQAGDFAITDFLDSFTFGTNGSQFVPKADADIAALASTVGGNSFCLDFANSSDLGNDISSNNNDFTPTSMASTNQSTNTPSNTYAVMDVLKNDGANTSTMVFSEGNTRVTGTGGSDGGAFSTLPLATTGTTEFQSTFNNGDGVVGICCYDNLLAVSSSASRNVTGGLGVNYNAAYGYQENGEKVVMLSSGVTRSTQGAALTTNSVVTVRYDADSNEITFLKDNVVQGSAVSTVAGLTYYAFVARFNNYDITLHFDSADFPHTIGSGNKTINTANLSAPTYQGIDYFAPTLYEGNGTGQRVGDFVPFTDAYTVDKSAMFNSADLRYLARTPSSGGNEKTLTFSTWIKITGVGNSNENAVLTTDDGSKEAQIRITGTTLATKKVQANLYNGSSFVLNISTDRTFGDTSSWNHLVVAYDTRAAVASANKVIIYINGVRQSVSGTDLATDDYDTEFNSTNEHNIGRQTNNGVGEPDFYLAETVMIDGQQLDATSFGQLDTSTNRWVPKDVSGLTFGTNGFYLKYENSPTNIAASETGLKSDDLDVGAVSLLTDGTQYGSWNAGSNLVYQNANSTTKSWWGVDFGSGVTKTIKSATLFGNQTGDGSSAGFTSVSGAVTWTLFGSNSAQATDDNDLSSLTSLGTASVADGITKGAAVTIDASSNTTAFRYFYVQMNTTASLRRLLGEIQLYETAGGGITNDSSGQNNDLVAAGAWVAGDQFTDTPSNNVFTFATDGTGTISEGNTRVDLNDSVYGLRPTVANFSSTGKFYGEFLVNAVSGNSVGIGFARDIASQDTTNPSTTPNNDSKNFLLQLSDGNKINGDSTGVSYGSGISAGQTVMWAFDAATRKIWFGSEGTFFASGDPAAGTNEAFILPNTGTVTLVTYDGSNARTANLTMRNATAAFEHTAPTGFTPFTQDNLDDTASKITAWAWIKNRDATDSHVLVDRVRGVGEVLHSNETAAEATEPNTVQRFLQRGVQVGSDVQVNTANESYVLWQWLLGDSATTGSTTSPAGTIASTSIAADAGHFSVGTYTGQTAAGTVGHGLGGIAEMVIVWDKGADNSIAVYHAGVASDAATDYLLLNQTDAATDNATFWNDTAPTSSVFSVGTGNNTNGNGRAKSFLAFRSVAGVCKVGSYIGNGNAAGPYISVGFKPSFIMIKRSVGGTGDWNILDTSREPFNDANPLVLRANLTTADEAGSIGDFDILSDGFKLKAVSANANTASSTYIYLAMADIGGNGTLPPIYGR